MIKAQHHAHRLLVVPFLPEKWQRRLGVRQYGFPSAPPEEPEREDLPPEGNADAGADIAGPPADLEILEEGSPADWSWRFRLLCKKVTGNAARCLVSLAAGAIGMHPTCYSCTDQENHVSVDLCLD